MRVSLYLSFCVVTVTLFLMVVLTCGKPQGVGIRVNNNALFTLGAGLLLTGLAFHAGQESTRHQQQQQYYPQNQYYRPTTSKKNNLKNEEMGNPMEPFLLALQHGEDGEDCDNLFSNCTLTSNQLIQQFQEMKAATSVKL
ncbi:hypothetical protein Pcinc_012608 [Petrolisthes cinctipes]|uniref:Uncharacterized protein n=1 Tax=Petrolisthes cinctipes TaxID=88211 RepID=A0AAE1FYJ3_PETCI|nr:hypothetical protein Pcinc_012608 [Petrolisthes cinctipes]